MQTQFQQENNTPKIEGPSFKGFQVTKTDDLSDKTSEPEKIKESKAELEARLKKEEIFRIAREKVRQDLRHQHRVKLKIKVIEPHPDTRPSMKGQVQKE